MKNFNTQQEVDSFFKDVTFKFEFISDGMVAFKTLNPIDVDGNYTEFMLTYYADEDIEFFCYSPYHNFDKMQLSEVRMFVAHNNETDQLYFRQYNHHEQN